MSKRLPIYVLCVLAVFGCKREKPEGTALPMDRDRPTDGTTNAAAPKTDKKPKSADDLKVGEVGIDQPKGSGSSLRYAVGTLKNDSDHARYGITIEVTLLDKNNQPLPTKASDYLQMLEPRKEWRFRAFVVDSKAVSAKISSVREEE